MVKKATFLLALTALFGASNIPAAFASHRTRVCNEVITSGTFRDVLVPENGTCTLRAVTVQKDVVVLEGGKLFVYGSRIEDDLRGRDPHSIVVDCNAEVAGCQPSFVGDDVTVSGASAQPADPGTPANYICNGTRIVGDLEIEDSGAGAPWRIGGGFCTVVNDGGNIIEGDVEFNSNAGALNFENNRIDEDALYEDNSGAIVIDNNDFGEDLDVEDNSGGVAITNNEIGDDLDCDDNDPEPTPSNTNTIHGDAKGQCSEGFAAP